MILLIFTLGLLIGSFLNVCIYRIPREESIAYPPSHCTKCETHLKPWDLIPVLSYISSLGRCRYCGESISPQYPFIELLNGMAYVLLFTVYGYTIDFMAYIILTSILILISGIDFKTQILPDGLVLTIFILGIIHKLSLMLIYNIPFGIINSTLGLLIGGGFLLLVAIISRGGMGGGDIKLLGVLGFWLGVRYTLLTMFLSFILGGVISAGLMLFKVKRKGEAIPFGPFIALGAYISIVYGGDIITWYLEKFII